MADGEGVEKRQQARVGNEGYVSLFPSKYTVEEIVGDARLDSTLTCTYVRTLDAEELGPRIAPVEVLLSAVEEAQESVESYCH